VTPLPTLAARIGARVRSSPLGVKLALLSAAATAVVVGVAFLVLRVRTEAVVRRVFVAELSASQRSLRQLQDQNLRLLLATSSLVSTSPTLRAALQTWRVESNSGLPPRNDLVVTIQHEVERIFADLNRDLLVVTDELGRVLVAVGPRGTPRAGEDLMRLPAVRYALASDGAAVDSGFGVLRRDGVPLQVGCVAIVLDGYPIGALVLGERLDSIMPRLDVAEGAHAVVTAGDRVLASTLAGTRAGARWTSHVESLRAPLGHIRIGSEDYIAATVPLGLTEDGRAATLYLVRSLTTSLTPIANSLGRSFLLAGVLAVLVVGAVGALVSRTTLRPLSRFVSFLRAGAESGPFARFDVAQAPAEIATLTDAYNRLIDSLSRQHGQLEQRTVELAETNETLREQVRVRERTEQALRESEEQLRQSQKLEALGTLAGGVAHDFNNLLSVILGHAHLSLEDLPVNSPYRDDLAQINQAADRAAGLVRQLLAFSRKQVLQPQVVDLNRIIQGMESMLRPLIGEDVDLQTKLEPRLARITADPGQIEQVLMNLLVNARDALPTGGTVVIETANVQLDERYERRPEALRAGPAVMLSVTDNGIGMDATTRGRIFEPFFTTKEPGKGTGLGLSTVYGIVRQSGGSITVYSHPGEGATFRCYFPPVAGVEAAAPPGPPVRPPTGSETVLVVEDEPQLRALMRRTLAGRGYAVLEAEHGRQALEIAAAHPGAIHLLLTDVVMPHLSGKELAERLLALRPGLRVLFISGYSDEAIERHGVLTPGAMYLQKPVLPDALARSVREVLDAEPAMRGA
jgi:signal transduction histidine kinase/CheY-like chemotaxis protein